MEIYFVRHGQTACNVNKLIQGRVDCELNETGINQAGQVADELKGIKFDAVYSSPLKRAVKTAEIILEANEVTDFSNFDITIDERVFEFAFGNLENESYKDIRKRDPNSLTEKEKNIYNLFVRPEIYIPDGGESYEDLFARIDDFIAEVREKHKNERVLVTSHGAYIHGVIARALSLEVKDFWLYDVANCSTTIFSDESGKLKVISELKKFGAIR